MEKKEKAMMGIIIGIFLVIIFVVGAVFFMHLNFEKMKKEKLEKQNQQQSGVSNYYETNVGEFNNGIAKFERNGKYGLIDEEGIEIVKDCEDIKFLENNILVKQSNSKWKLFDLFGKPLSTYDYDSIEISKEDKNLFVTTNGSKKGRINIKGEEIMPCMYEEIYYLGNKKYAIKSNFGWQLVDDNNKLVDSNIYEDVVVQEYKGDSNDSVIFAYLTLNHKVGLLSKDVNIPCEYYEIKILDKDKYAVKTDDGWRALGKDNKFISDDVYEKVDAIKI